MFLFNKKYLRKINQLSTTGRWLFIDPDFDAELITKKIKPIASISAPYSSTGIITSSFNIPTIYYDSTSKIDTSFEANNEICVFCVLQMCDTRGGYLGMTDVIYL